MPSSPDNDAARVYLPRATRDALGKLSPGRREALSHGFQRVGRQLLATAARADVVPGWANHTWPRRRYPQQCYPRTVKYVFDHPEIEGLRLVHGVISHPPQFVPLDHAWVELPGDIVFDGVVQAFFTLASYYTVMAAVAMDTYTSPETRQLVATHGHPGPWTASWVPTRVQLDTYAALRPLQSRASRAQGEREWRSERR